MIHEHIDFRDKLAESTNPILSLPSWHSNAGANKLQPTGFIRFTTCFCMACEVRMDFSFLNDRGEKIKRRIIFHNMRQLYEVHISISINRVLLQHTMLIYTLAMATFALQQQNRVVVLQPDNPNIFTTWPFTEQVGWHLFYGENTHGKKEKQKHPTTYMSYEGEKERPGQNAFSLVYP